MGINEVEKINWMQQIQVVFRLVPLDVIFIATSYLFAQSVQDAVYRVLTYKFPTDPFLANKWEWIFILFAIVLAVCSNLYLFSFKYHQMSTMNHCDNKKDYFIHINEQSVLPELPSSHHRYQSVRNHYTQWGWFKLIHQIWFYFIENHMALLFSTPWIIVINMLNFTAKSTVDMYLSMTDVLNPILYAIICVSYPVGIGVLYVTYFIWLGPETNGATSQTQKASINARTNDEQ